MEKQKRSLSNCYFFEVDGEWCIIPKAQVHLLTAADVEYPVLGMRIGGVETTILKTKLYELAATGTGYVAVSPIVGTPKDTPGLRYGGEMYLNLSPNHVLKTDREIKWDYTDDE
jgi:hypothetical protein